MRRQKARLTKVYKRYRKSAMGKRDVLSFLRSFMPEMIFRTTKLEGERISRRIVSSIFK